MEKVKLKHHRTPLIPRLDLVPSPPTSCPEQHGGHGEPGFLPPTPPSHFSSAPARVLHGPQGQSLLHHLEHLLGDGRAVSHTFSPSLPGSILPFLTPIFTGTPLAWLPGTGQPLTSPHKAPCSPPPAPGHGHPIQQEKYRLQEAIKEAWVSPVRESLKLEGKL